jgi:hypothetical protein
MKVMPRSTVPPVILDLVENIKMKHGYTKNVGSRERPIELLIPWTNKQARIAASERIVTTLLERIHTFTIRDTNYQVELSHKWYHERDSPLCGLSVRHTEWPIHLSLLEALAPGGGADWDEDVIKLFFPKNGISSADDNTPGDGEGLRLLVKKLMELSKIAQSASSTEAAAATTSFGFSQYPVQQPTTLGSRLADLNLIDLED